MSSYLTILGFLAVVLSPILIPLAVTLFDQAGRKLRHLTAAIDYRRTVRRQRVVASRSAEQESWQGRRCGRLPEVHIDKTKQPTAFNNTRLPMGLITTELPAVDPATWRSKGR